ncbi:MAG: MlaD family protein [Gammaproteobacteria bacterium]
MEIDSPGVSKRSGPSIVWLIPLLTALVGGWLVIKTISEQGPTATISFKTAEGIEAGKTRVKYKNVDIGVVEEIRFSDDFSNVIVTAQFNHGMDNFLRRNTRFWVVRPQLSLRGVSGLSTLVSGAYIEIDPGPGSPQEHFVGLEKQPVITADEAGKQVTLITEDLGSVDTGSPIYYQGLLAGEVLGYELGSDARSVYVHAFVRDPFDQLIRGNTRFWNVSGMDVSMGADGLKVRTESLQSLMFGGIAFETPDTLERSVEDVEDLIFTLYQDYDSIEEQAFTKKLKFVMYFDGSVRGLSVGAPVEFKGIKVGSVLDVRLEFNSEDTSFRIPVLVEIEPERIIDREAEEDIAPEQTLQTLVERGLRGRLQSGNLLTGQLFVELNMYPETDMELHPDNDLPYPELPTIPGSMETITRSVEQFVTRLEKVEIDKIADELLGTLEGANALTNAPEMKSTFANLEDSMESLRNILRQVDEAGIDETMATARSALRNLDEILVSTNRVLKPNSPLQYNVIKMTGELEETARAIRSLIEMLERHPQSLLLGRDAEGE